MTDTDTITADRRRELVSSPVPMIRSANVAVEFSWPTVDRIVRFGGDFTS